jgi:ATP-dependent Zn protease
MLWSQEKLKRHIGCSLVYIAVSVVVVLVNNCQVMAPLHSQPAPYSQFVRALNEGRVTQAVIGADSIVWQEGGGEEAGRYRADRVPGIDDAAIVERLRSIGAGVTSGAPNPFWRNLLGWLLPIALLIAVLGWITRRLLVANQVKRIS